METLAKGDMSVSALVRLLEAAGYDLKLVKLGHVRTVEDILAEQRQGDALQHACAGRVLRARTARADACDDRVIRAIGAATGLSGVGRARRRRGFAQQQIASGGRGA